jgi:hypothetical protein
MIEYVPQRALTKDQADAIMRGFDAVPADMRPTRALVAARIRSGEWKVFSCPTGVVVVGIVDYQTIRRLQLVTTCIEKGSMAVTARGLIKDLQRLAADWRCDAVETLCFNPRLAQAIMLHGGEFEAVAVTLPARA